MIALPNIFRTLLQSLFINQSLLAFTRMVTQVGISGTGLAFQGEQKNSTNVDAVSFAGKTAMSGNLKNEIVRFRIRDLYLPEPGVIFWMLHGNETLEGLVVELTDTGNPDEAFAVVQVEGVEQPMIVPLDRILQAV